jgi:hypothetical protein
VSPRQVYANCNVWQPWLGRGLVLRGDSCAGGTPPRLPGEDASAACGVLHLPPDFGGGWESAPWELQPKEWRRSNRKLQMFGNLGHLEDPRNTATPIVVGHYGRERLTRKITRRLAMLIALGESTHSFR